MRLWGRYSIIGVAAIGLLAGVAWLERARLAGWVVERPGSLPSFLLGAAVAVLILGLTLWVEHDALRMAWRARTGSLLRLEALAPPSPALRWLRGLPDPLEALTRPLASLPFLARVVQDWRDAGLGAKASRPILLLASTGFSAGWLDSASPGRSSVWRWHCRSRWRRAPGSGVGLRLPAADSVSNCLRLMDALASGLSAGLSFPQAVEYAAEELPRPAASALRTLSRRLALGFPLDRALVSLLDLYPDESLGMVVDGINLQRQFGGDLIRMLSETGERLRERVELEREVRAVTAQGRLSGWVLAALVPVSAGMLLLSNPRYIDVLFDTWIGQSLLVFSLLLQLAGWAVISRMVRIAY